MSGAAQFGSARRKGKEQEERERDGGCPYEIALLGIIKASKVPSLLIPFAVFFFIFYTLRLVQSQTSGESSGWVRYMKDARHEHKRAVAATCSLLPLSFFKFF